MTSKNMWLFFAVLSAIFAAATSILAKVGIEGVDFYMEDASRINSSVVRYTYHDIIKEE